MVRSTVNYRNETIRRIIFFYDRLPSEIGPGSRPARFFGWFHFCSITISI